MVEPLSFLASVIAVMEIAPTTPIWYDKLAEWRAEPWDCRHGKVTLAGDAAH